MVVETKGKIHPCCYKMSLHTEDLHGGIGYNGETINIYDGELYYAIEDILYCPFCGKRIVVTMP